MIDKRALENELTEVFITYQYRLDQPFQQINEGREKMELRYLSDPLFHAKVGSLVSGVMYIVGKHDTQP
jgi:hypothetical protein